jgi:hypothetical protein
MSKKTPDKAKPSAAAGEPPEKKPSKKSGKKPGLAKEWEKLHPAARWGIIGGGCVLLFFLFRAIGGDKSGSARETVFTLPSGTAAGSGGSGAGSGSPIGGGQSYNAGYLEGFMIGQIENQRTIDEQRAAWEQQQARQESWFEQMLGSVAGLFGAQANNNNQSGYNNAPGYSAGFNDFFLTEGHHDYQQRIFNDGSFEIWKDGRLIPEENFRFIPSAIGGTRDNRTTDDIVSVAYFSDLDRALQQAQQGWGHASASGDRAQMDYFAALGQTLREEGATDEGATRAWLAI